MTEFEAASLAISRAGLSASYIGLAIAAGNMLAAIVAAAGIWVFGLAMKRANDQRAVQAAEDRKVTQATLAALERQGDVLAEILRRTSPPPSQDGPQPGPAE